MGFRARLALAVSLAALAAAAPASAKVPQFRLATASPGHVTVQLFSIDLIGKHMGRARQRVKLGFRQPRKLPPSIRVLWATRSYRIRHGRRYAALAIVLNKAGATGSGAAIAHPAREPDPDFDELADLFLDIRPPPIYLPCAHCSKKVDKRHLWEGLCIDCELKQAKEEAAGRADADAATIDAIQSLEDMVGRDWNNLSGGTGSGFDPDIETGHYDDGHSFGWNKKPAKVEHAILHDIEVAQLPSIVPDAELAGGFDLDGNGVGQQITTIIGPPVIS